MPGLGGLRTVQPWQDGEPAGSGQPLMSTVLWSDLSGKEGQGLCPPA